MKAFMSSLEVLVIIAYRKVQIVSLKIMFSDAKWNDVVCEERLE